MVEAEDGQAVDLKGEGAARHDCIENELVGIEIWRVIAGCGGLNGELDNDERAIDEIAFPNSPFVDAASLD